jgi:rhodanese-related sulfurtransferase
MRKFLIILALLLAAVIPLTGCMSGDALSHEPVQTAFIQLISPEDAKEMIDTTGVILFDVRTQDEYDAGHIAGAVLLPYDSMTADSPGLPADKNTAIMVYCRSGGRSGVAASTLSELGYTRIYDLGGLLSWPYDTVKTGTSK